MAIRLTYNPTIHSASIGISHTEDNAITLCLRLADTIQWRLSMLWFVILKSIVIDVWSVPQKAQISRALQCCVRLCEVSREKNIKLVDLVVRHNILYGCRDLGYRR